MKKYVARHIDLIEDEEVRFVSFFADLNPSKRFATVGEMAEGFLYIASEVSKYMFSSELVVDGCGKAL